MHANLSQAVERAYEAVSGGGDDPFGWASRSARTWLQYESALGLFQEWCTELGAEWMPASTDTLRRYITDLIKSGRSPLTADAYLAAIAVAHRSRGHGFDRAALRNTIKGAKVLHDISPRQARPLLATDLGTLLAGLDRTRPADVRDGALLALGWSGAMRRSELVGLDWQRRHGGSEGGTGVVVRDRRGLVLTLARSKASQTVPVPIIVPAADMPSAIEFLDLWIKLAEVQPGQPVFRAVTSAQRIGATRLAAAAVSDMLKRRVRAHAIAEGASPSEAEQLAQATSGHSLRAGFCTTAAIKGVPEWKIRARSRHRSAEQVAGYVRAAEQWTNSALTGVGI